MARVKIPHFVAKPGAKGQRYFWQPSATLRAAGFRPERLPDDRRRALDRAQALNQGVAAWRAGTAPVGTDTPPPPDEIRRHSLAHVIRLYQASRHWTKLAPRSQRGYRQNLALLESWGGTAPVSAIGPKRIEALYEALAARTPAKAKAVVTMLGIVLNHAVRLEIIPARASLELGMEGAESSAAIWPADAVDAFVAAADQAGWYSLGTAIVLNHWMGQRQHDIIAMPRDAYRGGRFIVRPNKVRSKGVTVSIAENERVRDRVAQELARQATAKRTGPTLLLCESTGRAWREDHFRHVFADVRRTLAKARPSFKAADGAAVATETLLFMHLRHTAVTEHAIAGSTSLQIASITGHSSKTVDQILSRHYLARVEALADAATDKRNAADKSRG